jgi:isopropylmalate/homocitrate/citramalate synthase
VEVHYAVPDNEEGFWSFLSMKPEAFGNAQKNLLGHYSGPWAVRAKARELDLSIPEGKEREVLARIRSEMRWRKRQLGDDEFRQIVADVG